MIKEYQLPVLPYPTYELQPYIGDRTMEVHMILHTNYVKKTNAVLAQHPEIFNEDPVKLLANFRNLAPEVQGKIRSALGGHVNHLMFWDILAKDVKIPAEFKEVLEASFGSVEEFKRKFLETAVNHFGSGWVFLAMNKEGGLEIFSLPYQDNPLMGKAATGHSAYPVIMLDVWEHAYFLNYENRRPEYAENFWKVLNWEKAYENYKHAKTQLGELE